MGRRKFRRVRTVLGLTYDTTPEQMEAFLEGVKNIIKANEYTRKDYFQVVFSGYGASSLDVLLYFFLKVPDWSQELVQRQNVYLEIKRLARDIGVDFAFPTQTLHVESMPQDNQVSKEISNPELAQAAKDFGPTGSKAKPQGMGLFTAPYRES